MAIKLNEEAFQHAQDLIKGGLEVDRKSDNWAEDAPTRDEIDKFIENHFLKEYGLWYLGINADVEEKDSIQKYEYPYGDLKIVHKSALKEGLKKAHKDGNQEIVAAIEKLLKLIDEKK